MNEDHFKKISKYYNTLVGKYGHDPRSCDYGHSASQKIKFKVLGSCTDYTGKSILDIGCGFADYYDFLSGKFQNISYTGVDISHEMIKEAKRLHPGIQLDVKNVFESRPDQKYDIVTSNGIFYLLGDNAWGLMREFITTMFEISNEVIAFNSLSTWCADQEPGEFYADPLATLEFCRTLSPWVVLRHDYHSRDFTIFIYKEKHQ